MNKPNIYDKSILFIFYFNLICIRIINRFFDIGINVLHHVFPLAMIRTKGRDIEIISEVEKSLEGLRLGSETVRI